jgi:hypothetical protein
MAVVMGLIAAGAARAQSVGKPRPAATGSPLEAFARALDSHDSATEALSDWCADHHMADPPVIRAVRDRAVVKPASPTVRRLLRAGPTEPIRYRRVVLMCGDHAFSDADNWYRPLRLTAAMNDRLDHTDTPFGAVVRPLRFHRVRLAEGPVEPPAGGAAQPVLRRRALLATPSGMAFSLVVETYGSEVFAFPAAPSGPAPSPPAEAPETPPLGDVVKTM